MTDSQDKNQPQKPLPITPKKPLPGGGGPPASGDPTEIRSAA